MTPEQAERAKVLIAWAKPVEDEYGANGTKWDLAALLEEILVTEGFLESGTGDKQ